MRVFSYFGDPGGSFGRPGAHFEDLLGLCNFRHETRAKGHPLLVSIFIQKSAKCGKRTVRMLKSEVGDPS